MPILVLEMAQAGHLARPARIWAGNTMTRQSRFGDRSPGGSVAQLGGLLLAALSCVVLWTLAGACLMGPDKPGSGSMGLVLSNLLPLLPDLYEANTGFAKWQVGWAFSWQALNAWEDFHSPVKAVLADFFLIASYGYLLARGMGWAMARRAGAHGVGNPVPTALNRLGRAWPVALLGDVAENILTLAVIVTSPNAFTPALPYLLGLLMTLASMVKWLGLAACITLITSGLWPVQRPFKG